VFNVPSHKIIADAPRSFSLWLQVRQLIYGICDARTWEKAPTHGGDESGGATIPISVPRKLGETCAVASSHHHESIAFSRNSKQAGKLKYPTPERPYKKSRYPSSSSPFKLDGYIRLFLHYDVTIQCSCHVALFSNIFYYRSTQRSSRDARGTI
jgi:hypothetical protein